MKTHTIKFDELNSKFNWQMVMLLIGLALILVGTFSKIMLENTHFFVALGFLLMAAYHGRMFWHKHYVQWNKKGIVIRINSFLGKSLRFSEIRSSKMNEDKLVITKVNGEKVDISLSRIESSDALKLNNLLKQQAHL